MLLTLDIGNTSITIGIFDKDKLVGIKRIPSNIRYSLDKYTNLLVEEISNIKVHSCVIASVVNGLDKILYDAVLKAFDVESVILSTSSNIGIKLKLKDNNEIGTDRIANGVAAVALYKLPIIVVDFGTANTFDIINSKEEFVGGIIAPGINTQLTSLSQCTSKLPKLDAALSERAIGNNTIDAILSGVIRGTACMVEGLISECEKELGKKATIIATGGHCELISKYMKRKFDDVNPTLTLQGLKELYKLNANHARLQPQAL